MSGFTDGLILLGGQSRRMGQDKAQLKVAGKSLLMHQRHLMCPKVNQLFIVTNRIADEYASEVQASECFISDYYKSSEGPLSGLMSGLEHSEAEFLWVMSCDHYGLPEDILLKLKRALNDSGADVACIHSGGRRQPLMCLMRVEVVKAHLKTYLSSGARSVLGCYDALKVEDVMVETDGFWANLNTPDDYSALLFSLNNEI